MFFYCCIFCFNFVYTVPWSEPYLQGAIAEAGGIKALVDLIFKWPSGTDGVLVIFLHFSIMIITFI